MDGWRTRGARCAPAPVHLCTEPTATMMDILGALARSLRQAGAEGVSALVTRCEDPHARSEEPLHPVVAEQCSSTRLGILFHPMRGTTAPDERGFMPTGEPGMLSPVHVTHKTTSQRIGPGAGRRRVGSERWLRYRRTP